MIGSWFPIPEHVPDLPRWLSGETRTPFVTCKFAFSPTKPPLAKRDYIPDSYNNLHDWSGNFATQLPAIATRISWPTTSVTGLTAVLGTLTTKTQAVLDTQKALDAAVGQLNDAKAKRSRKSAWT